jgi:hypothetical protein
MAKNIARDGAPKRPQSATNIHSGMHHRTREGELRVGVTDHAAVASGGLVPSKNGGALPLMQSTLPGKFAMQHVASAGHRHRTTDALAGAAPGQNIARASREVDHALGTKILDQAYAHSFHDRMARMTFVPVTRKSPRSR